MHSTKISKNIDKMLLILYSELSYGNWLNSLTQSLTYTHALIHSHTRINSHTHSHNHHTHSHTLTLTITLLSQILFILTKKMWIAFSVFFLYFCKKIILCNKSHMRFWSLTFHLQYASIENYLKNIKSWINISFKGRIGNIHLAPLRFIFLHGKR